MELTAGAGYSREMVFAWSPKNPKSNWEFAYHFMLQSRVYLSAHSFLVSFSFCMEIEWRISVIISSRVEEIVDILLYTQFQAKNLTSEWLMDFYSLVLIARWICRKIKRKPRNFFRAMFVDTQHDSARLVVVDDRMSGIIVCGYLRLIMRTTKNVRSAQIITAC